MGGPLYQAFAAYAAWLDVGDGRFLRLHGAARRGLGGNFDTGWRPMARGAAPAGYEPVALARVDFASLRHRLGGAAPRLKSCRRSP